MSEMKLQRMINVIDPDLFKKGYNDLWTPEVESLVNKHFGSLDHMGDSELFGKTYIIDFEDHSDELAILPYINNVYSEKHKMCVKEIVGWLEKTSPSERRDIRRHYQDVPSRSAILSHDQCFGRLLCGRKGSGKTSLIKFNQNLLDKTDKYIFLYTALDVRISRRSSYTQEMTTSIVNKLDDLTLKITEKMDIDHEQVVLDRFRELWVLNAALPREDGDPKENLRENLLVKLHTTKYARDFYKYVTWSVSYLEKITGKYFILILDDIDHLSSDQEATEICGCANALFRKLKRPIIISVREETLHKLQDRVLPVDAFPKKHIIPPSFKKVLQIRLDNFKDDLKARHPKGCGKYSVAGIILFVEHIIQSMINQPRAYARLVTFHYDIDLLLDITRCLLCSPFMEPPEIIKKAKENKKIGWNLMLNSLQKYIYENHYDQNSFFLNVYDNTLQDVTEIDTSTQDPTYQDTFTRIALLRVLSHHLREKSSQPPGKRTIRVEEVKRDMRKLGYTNTMIWEALGAFARHRLIRTGKRQNALDKTIKNISISTAVLYYLDYLITEYRYIENILPVTPIDFRFDVEILPAEPETLSLNNIDTVVLQFADFVERCETCEQSCLKDLQFYNAIMEGETALSERIRHSVKKFQNERQFGG
jgi:hypothetical protein